MGKGKHAVGVNPVTNKVYVANHDAGTVTVIDGSDNTTLTVPVGDGPIAVGVNPITNKIYIANNASTYVTVINGNDNTTLTLPVETISTAVGVNLITNKIYVINAPFVTIIDGYDNSTQTVPAGDGSIAVAVNPVTNKIYVANSASDSVAIIDGSDNTTHILPTGQVPYAVAANLVTNKVYVTNYSSDDMMVITPAATQANPLTTTISPLPNNVATRSQPTFSFSATSSYSPTSPTIQQIYYQVDTWTGSWIKATPSGAAATGQTPPLQPGVHIIYAYAVDGQEATSINTDRGSSPNLGQVAAYLFLVRPARATVNLPLILNTDPS